MQSARLPLPTRIARSFYFVRSLRGGLKFSILATPHHVNREFVVDNGGIRFNCDLGSYLEWNLATLTDYEWNEKRLFLNLFPPHRRSTILDIGANIGAHSLSFSRAFKRVISFEPNPPIYSRLLGNLALNPSAAIEPVNIGLGDEEATLTFYQPLPGFENQGSGTFDLAFAPERYREVHLPVTRGDHYLSQQGIENIDGVKIDVQGFEPQVLVGLKETLHRCRPIVWLEISNATLDQIATKGGLQTITPPDYSLHKFVSRARFGVVHRMTIERCADMNPRDEGDYILVPNDWN